MKTSTTYGLVLVALGLSAALGLDALAGRSGEEKAAQVPLPPNPAAAPVRLVAAQPFVLDEPYTHWYRAEQPTVQAGYILVLEAEPELTRPRQTFEAVLYVGNETAERCNSAERFGNLVVLVPSALDAEGNVALDPWRVLIWFGDPALPEQVDAATIASQRAKAEAQGVLPAAAGVKRTALSSLATHFARDRTDLDLVIADHIERYSPSEVDLISGLRVPVTR